MEQDKLSDRGFQCHLPKAALPKQRKCLPRRRIKQVFVLDGDKMKFRYTTKIRAGGNGFGLSAEDVMYTLNTVDQHMVGIVK